MDPNVLQDVQQKVKQLNTQYPAPVEREFGPAKEVKIDEGTPVHSIFGRFEDVMCNYLVVLKNNNTKVFLVLYNGQDLMIVREVLDCMERLAIIQQYKNETGLGE